VIVLSQKEAKFEVAKVVQKIEQDIIDEIVAQRMAGRMEELNKMKAAIEAEAEENRKNMEARFRGMEQTLKLEMAQKMKEIEEANLAKRDITDLEKQKEEIMFEIESLKSDIKQEKENFGIRERMRKILNASIYGLPQLAFLVKEKLVKSDCACDLSIEELNDLKKTLESVSSSAYEAMLAAQEVLDGLKQKAGLRIVKN
jgi:hypothetical protein